ncbi:MAG: substrate-binding domain-containing protein [Rubrivivax sp.]
MRPALSGISSMATRRVLEDLSADYERRSGQAVAIQSVGGVDAARRVQAGEAFDVVILASDAIERLAAGAHLVPGSRVDLVRSPVAVAVRRGTAPPDIGSEDALRRTVLAARTIGYSTGPSGTHLSGLFQRWGVAETLRARVVTPPPGVPVGRLVAEGEVELGFQQLAELIALEGITVVGTLPPGADFITTFAGGVGASSTRAAEAAALLEFLHSPEASAAKRLHGMEPA